MYACMCVCCAITITIAIAQRVLFLSLLSIVMQKKNVKRLKNRDVIQPAKSQQRERARERNRERAKISTKLYLFIICQT